MTMHSIRRIIYTITSITRKIHFQLFLYQWEVCNENLFLSYDFSKPPPPHPFIILWRSSTYKIKINLWLTAPKGATPVN